MLGCLIARLRDKKAGVQREAASQCAAVMRAWVLASAADPGSAPRMEMILGIPLVLCNLAVRDPELGAHIFDMVFRAGIFPAKLAPADVAHLWALLWKQAGERAGGAVGGSARRRAELAACRLAGQLLGACRPAARTLNVHHLVLPVPLQARRGALCWPRSCRWVPWLAG